MGHRSKTLLHLIGDTLQFANIRNLKKLPFYSKGRQLLRPSDIFAIAIQATPETVVFTLIKFANEFVLPKELDKLFGQAIKKRQGIP